MSENTQAERRITCRIEDETIIVDLGADDRSERLYLTFEESQALFDGIGNVLFYGDGGGERQVVVADVKLSPDDAFQLTEQMSFAHTEWCEAKRRRTSDRVNWKEEGF